MIELHNELNFGDNAVYGEHSDNQEDSDVCLRIKKGKEVQQSGHIPTKKNCVVVFQFIKEFLYGSECNYSIAYYVDALYSPACLLDGSV